MLQYMLDTNICILVLKTYPAELRERFNELAEQLAISSITLAELHHGVERSSRREANRAALAQFTARLEVLPFAGKAAAQYGRLRVELERMGRPGGLHDMLIAAHARSEGLTVVTSDTRGFAHVPGLAVEAWV